MKISELCHQLESIAPLHLQESYDNAGLIVGKAEAEITGVMVCLDAIEAVVDEAAQKGCNLIVAHHPIVFSGLKRLTYANYIERTVAAALKNDIAIYAIHTNLDNVLRQGVNERIAERLGLEDVQILQPKGEDPNIGSGAIGKLSKSLPEKAFLAHLAKAMKASCVRHTALLGKPVRRIAVCGGSGSFLLSQALRQEADVFVTADYKYHQFFDADAKIVIADIGHFESEQFTIDLLYEIISEKSRNFAVRKTEVITNPVQYFQP